MSRNKSIFVLARSKLVQSTNSKVLISSNHVIMFEFNLRKGVCNYSKFLLMLLLLILNEMFEFFLSLSLFLDIVIKLLPSHRLFFNFETIHPILEHSLHHLFINQSFMIILHIFLYFVFGTICFQFFLDYF